MTTTKDNQTLFQSLSKVTQIIAAGLLTLALAVVIQVASTSVASAQIHGGHEHVEPVCLEAGPPNLEAGLTQCESPESPQEEPLIDDPQDPGPVIPCPYSSCNDWDIDKNWGNDPGPEPFIETVLHVWITVDFSSLDAIQHFGNSVCDESIGHLYGIRCAFYNLPDHLRPFVTPDN